MKSVLLSKLKHLVRGDDGAALVITLGVFFFMYIFCAGVYAIGFAVKERIQLQNACDAAAYSAAVVQADTISRIATINRAMAWTYSQLCKRQMDYIVYKLARHTADHYNRDLNMVKANLAWGGAHHHPCWWSFRPDNFPPSLGDYGVRWNQRRVNVNRESPFAEVDGLDEACRHFLENYLTGDSYYASDLPSGRTIERLRKQIEADKTVIVQMNGEISALISGLPSRIDTAADAIARANLPQNMEGQCKIVVERSSSPMDDCFSYMSGTDDEQLFISWSGDRHLSDMVDWLPLKGGEGFLRSYEQNGEYLSSHWMWEAYQWNCSNIIPCFITPIVTSCSHVGCEYGDYCGVSTVHRVDLTAEDLRDGDECYDGERAKPVKVKAGYFGHAGTITVGLMRKATSPWAPIFGAVTKGFYTAFNPYCDTYCFASAKAGYKLYQLPEEETYDGADSLGWEARHNGRPRAFRGGRDYCIDWKEPIPLRSNWVYGTRDEFDEKGMLVRHEEKYLSIPTEGTAARYERDGWKLDREPSGRLKRQPRYTAWRQSWNLTQSDWDAVLLPVRQGGTMAKETSVNSHLEWMMSVRDQTVCRYSYEPVWQWNGEESASFVAGLVGDVGWKDLDGKVALAGRFGDMFAGGVHDPDPNGDWGENFIEKTLAGWNGWWDIPKTQADHSEKVQSRWNIEKQHGQLEWSNISRLMFH